MSVRPQSTWQVSMGKCLLTLLFVEDLKVALDVAIECSQYFQSIVYNNLNSKLISQQIVSEIKRFINSLFVLGYH